MHSRDPSISTDKIHVVDLVLDVSRTDSEMLKKISPAISAVIYPKDLFPLAKQYWQHSGDGVQSRRAEFCHGLFQEGILVEKSVLQPLSNGFQKGPRRYQKGSVDKTPPKAHQNGSDVVKTRNDSSLNGSAENRESSQFLEERFGRNLDVSFVDNAKSAIRRRIAGSLMGEVDLSATPGPDMGSNRRGVADISESDVYLYPCGMNSIFNAHRMMLEARGPMKSISFGFPYVDTLKILEKFGPGCVFYGNGESEDLDDLESR